MITIKEKSSTKHSCSNRWCGRSFNEPRIVIDVKTQRTIKACPYCYAELTQGYTVECVHYFGYLHEKDKGEKIPEECLVCKDTVACMLSKLQKSKRSVKEISKWYKFK